MEDETCMEYLFRCISNDHPKDIDQNILFNASNEFRNLWNLVRKLRELARVDVQKITRFLDAVQDALEKKSWNGVAIQCIQAKTEYKQIRRYIRPSFLEDFKVARFIETSVKSKSGTKKDNKPTISSGNQQRRQNFRNKQINKQNDVTGTDKSVVQKTNKETTVTKQSKETDSTEKSTDEEKGITNALDPGNQGKYDKFKAKHTRTDAKAKDVTQGKARERGNKNLNTHSTKVKELFENNSTDNHINKYDQLQNDFISKVKDDDDSVKHTSPNASFQEKDKGENNKNELNKEPEEVDNNDKDISMKKECSKRNCDEINLKTLDEKESNNSKIESSDTSLKGDSLTLSQNTQDELQNTNHANDQHNCKYNVNARNEVASSQTLDISFLVSKRLTEMEYDCNANEIIAELKCIYEMDWTTAYKALTGCTPSNGMKNTIDFLGEILKVAAQKVKIIPENDPAFSSTGNVTSGLTEELGKFKKDFLRQHLKELQAEHSIEYASGTDGELSINVYAAKCVELAWFMYTRQPPMTFDYDSRPMLLEDLFEIFKPYKNKGNCIHYIVWPAIRRHACGTVVAQGIAEFR